MTKTAGTVKIQICNGRRRTLARLRAVLRAHISSESPPDVGSFLLALKACSRLQDVHWGKEIHADADEAGCSSNVCVENTLISMYSRCEDMFLALKVFRKMHVHDVISWTVIITGYVANGNNMTALELFRCMRREGCQPNARTFVAAFKACTGLAEEEGGRVVLGGTVKLNSLEMGMRVHSLAVELQSDRDMYVASTLVKLYSKCGSMLDARSVFDKNVTLLLNDVVSWTSLMNGYVENGEPDLALQLFRCMRAEPDDRAFLAALQACFRLADEERSSEVDGPKLTSLEKGMTLHSQAAKLGHLEDRFVANAVVIMYAKCGSLVDARTVFQGMKRHDVVSWTGLLTGYVEAGQGDAALEVFTCMRSEGCPPNGRTFVTVLQACMVTSAKEQGILVNGKVVKVRSLETGMWIHSLAAEDGFVIGETFVTNSLVDMYSKCGTMLDSRTVFDKAVSRTLVSWTCLILGYVENGNSNLALKLFECMSLEGFFPDSQAYVAAIKACGNLGALEKGRRIHEDVSRNKQYKDVIVENALVDLYAKCGAMQEARTVFETMNSRRNLVTWSSLIAGYSRQGESELVFSMFRRMREEGFGADRVILLSILTSCSHAGLVDEGVEYFEGMVPLYRVKPELEHYHCMVDMFARANRLEAAVSMVETMPFEATVVSWATVLAGCCKWKNLALGKVAFDKIVRLDVQHAAAHSLMANLLASI